MLFRSQDVSTLVVVVVGCDLHNFMSKYVNAALLHLPRVTRLGDFLDFGQLFKAFVNN